MTEEKKKYKVVLDRGGCIGAASCVAAQPERWVLDIDDNKVNLIDGKKVVKDGIETWELEFSEEELERFMAAAEVCPVNVIHIYDEDGNMLI